MNAFESITLNLSPRIGRAFLRSRSGHIHSLVRSCLVCRMRYAYRSGSTRSDKRRSIFDFSQVVSGHGCARGAVRRTVGAMRHGISSSLTTLIQAMRKEVYHEAIDVLYASNTFDISDLGILKYFVQGVPPKRLALIRDLRVHWSTSLLPSSQPAAHKDFGGTWEMFWRIATVELKGLRTVNIMLCGHDQENNMPNEASHSLNSWREFLNWEFWWDPSAKARCRLVQGRKKQ
ncbi:MAG: hypothetical protein LQ345_006592 [Seirophora villosa]|nr:MAG: hypothetical protein LQ345_006592 [Seirophora villosa]